MHLRNGFLDYCRLIAAVGIVWFHSEAPGYRVAYIALPFFLVLLAQPTRSSVSDRARRLMRLFVVWSGIYAVLWMAVALYYGLDIFVWWRSWMLVAGTSIHLWFLPFAFFVTLVAPLLRRTKATVVLSVVAAAALALAGETRAYPWYQWSLGVIPVLIGFVHARSDRMATLVLLSSFLILEVFRPSADNLIIFAGSAVAIVAFSISMPATWLSNWCARISLWVYLDHMFVIYLVEAQGIQGIELALLTILASVALAIGIEVVVRWIRPATA